MRKHECQKKHTPNIKLALLKFPRELNSEKDLVNTMCTTITEISAFILGCVWIKDLVREKEMEMEMEKGR